MIVLNVFGCSYNSVEQNKTVVISVSKQSYSSKDDVQYFYTNKTGFDINFFICNGQMSPTVEVQQLKSGTWLLVWANVCNGFNSYCCGIIKKDESNAILFPTNILDSGIYRLKLNLSVNGTNRDFFSESFTITN